MLQHLHGRAWVAPGGANIGVIKGDDGRTVLIDTGLNDSSVRKVLRDLSDDGRSVTSIVTTHGHADHFGGNAFVVKRTGANVYAPAGDEAILRYPLLQPITLFAGADPPASMRGGFMLAEASPVDQIYDAGVLTVDGIGLEAISLAGHSGNQMGIRVDDVFYCADVVLPERVIERYKMPYLFSVGSHLRALAVAGEAEYQVAVPGHGPIVERLDDLVAGNRDLVLDVADRVVRIADDWTTADDILAMVLAELGADPQDAPSYYLLHPTIYAFLSYLESEQRIEHTITGGRSLWKRR